MKCFLSILFLIIAYSSYAQKDSISDLDKVKKLSPHKFYTVLKTNPLTPLWGAIPLTSEYRITLEAVNGKNKSAQFSVSYLGKSPLFTLFENAANNGGLQDIDIIMRGFRIQLSQRFFFNKLNKQFGLEYAPIGFYFSPHLSYSSALFSDKTSLQYGYYFAIEHINANALFGLQIPVGNKFIFEIFGGLGYKRNRWIEFGPQYSRKIDPGFGAFYNGPVKLSFGFNAGFGF